MFLALHLPDDLSYGCSAHLIPCGGSFVYLRDIWRSPIGKFLFTSVVIQSLLYETYGFFAHWSFENVFANWSFDLFLPIGLLKMFNLKLA